MGITSERAHLPTLVVLRLAQGGGQPSGSVAQGWDSVLLGGILQLPYLTSGMCSKCFSLPLRKGSQTGAF